MKKPWKTISSKIVYKNPYYYIRKDKVIKPDGKKGFYDVVVKPSSVFIVAMNDKGEVAMVKLYRYTNSVFSLEIPAGSSDDQKPLVAAKRELQEETGLIARKWKMMGKFQTANGIMQQMEYLYLATELKQTPNDNKAEEGISKVQFIPIRMALRMILEHKITDIQTTNALLMVAVKLGHIS